MRKGFAATEIAFEGARSLSFDHYGGYLLASDEKKVGIYAGKQWAQQLTQIIAELKECRFNEKCEVVGVEKNKVVKF